MKAWHQQREQEASGRTKSTSKLDYSKFDAIVDSDDEADQPVRARAPLPPPQQRMPPGVERALADLQSAQERGDVREQERAARRLEECVEHAPPEFQEVFQQVRAGRDGALPASGDQSTAKALREARALEKQHASHESLLEELQRDPAKMVEAMMEAGISEEQLATPEGQQAAMARFGEYMSRRLPSAGAGTLAGKRVGGSGAGKRGAGIDPNIVAIDPSLSRAASELEAQREAMERAQAEYREQAAIESRRWCHGA